MEILRTLITTAANDSDEAYLDNWSDGMAAEGIYLDIDMPVTCGANGTPTLVDLKDVLAYFLGIFSLSYGALRQHKPYIGVDGSKLRNVHRTMTMTEVWNDFVGVAAQGTIAAHVWRARIFITPNRQKADGLNRALGWTQGRSIQLANKEGAALTAGALVKSRTAALNATTRVVAAYRMGEDNFTHLPFYREVNRAALDVTGPDGKLLAFWDDNAAYAATAIGKYSLKLGKKEYFRQVEPKYAYYDYVRDLDAGGSDIADEVTQLYMADPFADEREIPTGIPYLKLIAQDVATIKARFVYLPVVSDEEATTVIAEAAKSRGEEVTGTLTNPPERETQNGSAATSQIELVGATHPKFGQEPGLAADTHGNVRVHVPEGVAWGARGLPPGLRRRAQKLLSLRVPGATTTDGKGRTGSIREFVRNIVES